ncbi:MAG: GTPase HflX [Eubacteriales bacterium]
MNKSPVFDKTSEELPRVLIAGIVTPEVTQSMCDASMDELERLVDTAGGIVVCRVTQSKFAPDKATFVGSGKVLEIASTVKENGISLLVFDGELSPSQIRNLEDAMGDAQVIDRSMLILEIFSLHAQTGEGKLQVEIAKLRYSYPRLTGHGNELSRLGGGGAGGGGARRGAGESKLELDRRYVKHRISTLESELERLETSRGVMRRQREKSGIPCVAIAGYTNAGKSTLLNYLTGAGILADDKLFATLDPTTRKLTLPSGAEVLLTDTVGFIRNLPHHLIKAFKSTLDEVRYADVIVLVADVSDSERQAQLEVTQKLLAELGAGDKPIVLALNKCDMLEDRKRLPSDSEAVFISAKTGEGIDELLQRITDIIEKNSAVTRFVFPNSQQGHVSTLYRLAKVTDIEYGEETTTVTALADSKVRGLLGQYISQ